MNFYLIGMDYKSAALSIRETVYKKRKAMDVFLDGHAPGRHIVLSTCNRMEIYATTGAEAEINDIAGAFLEQFPEFDKYGYIETETKRIFRHLVRLAAGLESQIRGETEILGQLDILHNDRLFPKGFSRLWHDAIKLGRYIRLETSLNDSGRNIAAAIFDDIFKRVNHDRRIEVAVIGTGKVASLFALNSRPDARLSFLANKNHKKARELALAAGGTALALDDLAKVLVTSDVVISATKSPHFIIKNNLSSAIAGREGPLYIYDLAFPRDIDPALGKTERIILQNSEGLEGIFREYNVCIEDRVTLAGYLVEEAARNYMEDYDEKQVACRSASKFISNKAG